MSNSRRGGKEKLFFSLEVTWRGDVLLGTPSETDTSNTVPLPVSESLYFFISSAVGKDVVFLFTRHKVELVGGIGPTVGKVVYLDHD